MFKVLHTCPLCGSSNLVEISEELIRESDVIICENEWFIHLRRAYNDLLVHTKKSVVEEEIEPILSLSL